MMPFGRGDWLTLFAHFLSLSLLAVGGAITTAPDMHRYLVDETHWLSDTQFTSSIALAQAAPGPHILFVALMGWNVGLNAATGLGSGAWTSAGLAGMGLLVAMLGIMLPSSILTYKATQWTHQNRDLRSVRAFKSGMAPIVIGLLVSTGWLLSAAHHDFQQDWKVWLVTAAATVLMLKTNLHLLWMIAKIGRAHV